jgi:hypothetical protein
MQEGRLERTPVRALASGTVSTAVTAEDTHAASSTPSRAPADMGGPEAFLHQGRGRDDIGILTDGRHGAAVAAQLHGQYPWLLLAGAALVSITANITHALVAADDTVPGIVAALVASVPPIVHHRHRRDDDYPVHDQRPYPREPHRGARAGREVRERGER